MMNHLHQYNQNHWQFESLFSVCLVNCNIAVPSKEIYHSDEPGGDCVIFLCKASLYKPPYSVLFH